MVAHLTREAGKDFVSTLKLDAEAGVAEAFKNLACGFYSFFFRHALLNPCACGAVNSR